MWEVPLDHQGSPQAALKGEEILLHATTWINLDDIMKRKISQPQKDKYSTIPLMRGTLSRKIHRYRSRKTSTRANIKQWGNWRVVV